MNPRVSGGSGRSFSPPPRYSAVGTSGHWRNRSIVAEKRREASKGVGSLERRRVSALYSSPPLAGPIRDSRQDSRVLRFGKNREAGMSVLFTVGYEGTDIERFVKTLKAVGIRRLADVRAVAVSRKPGFSKRRLSDRLADEVIEYIHFVELGDPKPGRDAARSGKLPRPPLGRPFEAQRPARGHPCHSPRRAR